MTAQKIVRPAGLQASRGIKQNDSYIVAKIQKKASPFLKGGCDD
jgi:hypothetical protein